MRLPTTQSRRQVMTCLTPKALKSLKDLVVIAKNNHDFMKDRAHAARDAKDIIGIDRATSQAFKWSSVAARGSRSI